MPRKNPTNQPVQAPWVEPQIPQLLECGLSPQWPKRNLKPQARLEGFGGNKPLFARQKGQQRHPSNFPILALSLSLFFLSHATLFFNLPIPPTGSCCSLTQHSHSHNYRQNGHLSSDVSESIPNCSGANPLHGAIMRDSLIRMLTLFTIAPTWSSFLE